MSKCNLVLNLSDNDNSSRSLGQYFGSSKNNNVIFNRHIEIFLPKMWAVVVDKYNINDWDIIYSHVISHEIIHAVIHENIGRNATVQFDDIAGIIPRDIRQIGIGMNKYKEEDIK